MKRAERHRLKENELAISVTRLKETFDQHQRQIVAGAVVAAAAVVVVLGYLYWRSGTDAASRALLVEAMTVADAPVVPPTPPPAPGTPSAPPPTVPPPGSFPTEQAKLEAALRKFMAAADAYPTTKSGVAARFQAATILAALGRHGEAVQRFKEVVDRTPTGIYADAARLGIAAAEASAGQYDRAIAAFKELSAVRDGPMPADGILMQLARAYAMAGKSADALKTYQRIVDEFPQSVFAAAARREVEIAKIPGAN